jgi:hypothetical protein
MGVREVKPSSSQDSLSVVFIYSGEFAERVIRNLVNDPSFCKSCGLYCDSCKYGVYSHVQNIIGAIQLPSPSKLPAFIDHPEEYLPKRIPKADLCVTSGLHKDLLLDLPHQLSEVGINALIVPIEDFLEVPSGLRIQVEETCQKLGLESAFPKPFCTLTPIKNKPVISRFVTELGIGRPLLELSTTTRGGSETIESTIVRRSAPCGSTWYVAKKLLGVETKRDILYDAIAKAHHSYPCTATMNVDPEINEPILHLGGFTIREEVENALASMKSTQN